MSRVQAPLLTPFNPPSEKHKKLSIRNVSEPNINGLDRAFSRLGTGRDCGGHFCASLCFVRASRFCPRYKVTHLNRNLFKKTSKGHLPPSKWVFSGLFFCLARFGRRLTTRPQRAGGQLPKARKVLCETQRSTGLKIHEGGKVFNFYFFGRKSVLAVLVDYQRPPSCRLIHLR